MLLFASFLLQMIVWLDFHLIIKFFAVVFIFWVVYVLWRETKEPPVSANEEEGLSGELLGDHEVLLDAEKLHPLLNIIDAHREMSFFSMAIVGVWGSGKSSYLKTLKKETSDKYEVVYINTWELENSGNAINEVQKEFDSIIFKDSKAKWFLHTIKALIQRDYFGILSKYFVKHEITLPNIFEPTFSSSRYQYNQLLKSVLHTKKIILILDELDRLSDKSDILNILKVIRYSASFDNVFVITALDLKQVMAKLEEDAEYIQKIFNIKYEIPKPSENDFFNYTRKKVLEKFEPFTDTAKIENMLITIDTKSEKMLLSIIPTYRVLKSSFDEAYVFVKYLHGHYEESWRDYISPEFILVLNILKSMSMNDYIYLVTDGNLISELEEIGKDDSAGRKNVEESTCAVLRILKTNIFLGRIESYLSVYKNYAIHDYNVNYKKYTSYTSDPRLIDEDLSRLHIESDRTRFLVDLITHIYHDKNNQQIILKKIVDLMVQLESNLDEDAVFEAMALTRENARTLVTEENKGVLAGLLDDKELGFSFLNVIFDNRRLPYLGRLIEHSVVLYLFEHYLKNGHCAEIDPEELDHKFRLLFLRNSTLSNIDLYQKEDDRQDDEKREESRFSDDIRKAILKHCLKSQKPTVVRLLLESMPFEYAVKFFTDNGCQLSDLLDDGAEYTLQIETENGTHIYKPHTAKEIKELLNDPKL